MNISLFVVQESENVCHYLNEQGFKTVNMVGGMLQYEGEKKRLKNLKRVCFKFFIQYKKEEGKWGLICVK